MVTRFVTSEPVQYRTDPRYSMAYLFCTGMPFSFIFYFLFF